MYAINSENGHDIWKKKYIGSIRNLSVTNDALVFGITDGLLTNKYYSASINALNINDGSELWKADVSSAIVSEVMILEGAVLYRGLDYNSSEKISDNKWDDFLYILN